MIAKVTGHSHSRKDAADFRYLSETARRADFGLSPVSSDTIENLIGKPRRIYARSESGLDRVPPATDADGKKHGLITRELADDLHARLDRGERLYMRVRVERTEPRSDHGFALSDERGAVRPLTYAAHCASRDRGLTTDCSPAKSRTSCEAAMRDLLKDRTFTTKAIKDRETGTFHGEKIVAHSLVLAPSDRELARIKEAGLPADEILAKAAQRTFEHYERARGKGRLFAFGALHVEAGDQVRPH